LRRDLDVRVKGEEVAQRRCSDYSRCGAAILLAVGYLAGLAGCAESKPTLYPASVTVTYPDKKPVVGAQVVFRSVEHKLSARGVTGEDGSCRLTTFEPEDGALPGRHLVLVAEPPLKGDPDVPSRGPQIADRFASFNTSDLEVTVKDDGSPNLFPLIVTAN
jgi:hypothetical protein